MNHLPPFKFDESANSPDFTEAEAAEAIATGCAEDIPPHLTGLVCDCGKPLDVAKHEKRFRFPHFYWRTRLECRDGHWDQRVFQVTWLYEGTHPVPR